MLLPPSVVDICGFCLPGIYCFSLWWNPSWTLGNHQSRWDSSFRSRDQARPVRYSLAGTGMLDEVTLGQKMDKAHPPGSSSMKGGRTAPVWRPPLAAIPSFQAQIFSFSFALRATADLFSWPFWSVEWASDGFCYERTLIHPMQKPASPLQRLHSKLREDPAVQEAQESSPAEEFPPPSWCPELAGLHKAPSAGKRSDCVRTAVCPGRESDCPGEEREDWTGAIIFLLTQGKVLTGFCCWGIKSQWAYPLYRHFSFLILWFKCSNTWLRTKWKCAPRPIRISKSPCDCGVWGTSQFERPPHPGFQPHPLLHPPWPVHTTSWGHLFRPTALGSPPWLCIQITSRGFSKYWFLTPTTEMRL